MPARSDGYEKSDGNTAEELEQGPPIWVWIGGSNNNVNVAVQNKGNVKQEQKVGHAVGGTLSDDDKLALRRVASSLFLADELDLDPKVKLEGQKRLMASARAAQLHQNLRAILLSANSSQAKHQQEMRTTTFLNLNVQQDIDQRELQDAAPSELNLDTSRQLSYTECGGERVPFPFNPREVDWESMKSAIKKMCDSAREGQKILIAGRAPLPAFFWLGFLLQPWGGGRQVIMNRRKTGTWDIIDPNVESKAPSPFELAPNGIVKSEAQGLVAVFVTYRTSSMEADLAPVEQYAKAQGKKLAGTVVLGARHPPATVDAKTGPAISNQLLELITQIPSKFPKQQGLMLFLDAPGSLAFLLGRAVNANLFKEIHVPQFSHGEYFPAVIHVAASALPKYEWEIFLAHAGPDRKVAEELYELLNDDRSLPVFLDSKRLMPGDDWDSALDSAQRASRITVVLVSSKTDDAYYQREEIARAIDSARKGEHRVVPIYLPGADGASVPYGLRLKHSIRMDNLSELPSVADRLRELVHDLKRRPRPGR